MPSLFLCADDPGWVPGDGEALKRLLDGLGLIDGNSKTEGCAERFRVGKQFLGLVIFLGCSPRVVVDPAEDGDGQAACFVQQHTYPEVSFIAATGQLRVRCPACRTPAIDVVIGEKHDMLFTCTHCQTASPLDRLDWRQSAAYGRYFIEIGGVHPHEALPSDRLLVALKSFSGAGWRYFYAGG